MKTKNSLAIVLIAITCLLSCEPVVERAREEFEDVTSPERGT